MSRTFTLFSIYTGLSDQAEYFPTARAAERGARATLRQTGLHSIMIEKHRTVPIGLNSLIAILNSNGGQWCAHTADFKLIVADRRGHSRKPASDDELPF